MKNKLLGLALVACFSTVALSSCGSNKWLKKSDKVVVTIDGTEYTTEDLFGQLATSNATGVAAYYNAISEVIVRNATRSYAESTELKKAVDASVDQLKEEAHNNADANGTSYKKEWNAILENKGVESEKELIEQLTYNELQSHLQDEYYDLNSNELLEDYLNEMLPYHVRHILVKVSASAGTLARGTITQSEALKLASVVRRMANLNEDGTVKKTTETFGEVAFQASEDTGSASLYGNLDVMTTSTSFVNEFKLGIYAYESLFAHKNADSRAQYFTDTTADTTYGVSLQKNTYAIPTDAQTAWSSRQETITTDSTWNGTEEVATSTYQRRKDGIGFIPFSVTQKIGEVADMVTNPRTNKKVNDGDADYYPRNIYFNYYFNDHGISVITNETEVGNFKRVVGFDKPILCADGDVNKPVLVTRAGSSYQGVHFMVVEKSAIGSTNEELTTYYDKRTPAQLTKDGNADLIGKTYVTAIKSTDTSTYSSRSKAIESEVKGFDSMIDTRMFEYYLGLSTDEEGNLITPVDKDGNSLPSIKIADEKIQETLLKYIQVRRAGNKSDAINSNKDAWDSYIDLLKEQDSFAAKRRIPLVCASRFEEGKIDSVSNGGSCYEQK